MIQHLQIANLLNGDVRRAIHTTRYSRCAVHRVESVAEHVFNTMCYASVLAHHLIEDGVSVDLGQVLNKSLWHDTEEPAGIGDILRKVKHSSTEFLKLVEGLGVREVFRVNRELGFLNHSPILDYWLTSKDDTIEGEIVRVADGLSVIAYVVEEYLLGNRTMRDVHEEVVGYLQSMIDKVQNQQLKAVVTMTMAYFIEKVEYYK